MKDQSILNSSSKKDESYLDDLAFAVCVNGESLEKYRKIVEKKFGADVFSNMVQFASTIDQQVKRRQFTNTSLLSLKFLGKNAGLSEMAIDMIVDHFRGEFQEEQLKEERRKNEDTAFWKQCNPSNKYQLKEYLKKYPTGLFAEHAVSLIADLERIEKMAIKESRMFNQCRTQRDYMNYLSKYPNGAYVTKAKVIIEDLGRKEIEENRVYNLCKDKSDYIGYLRKYPNGKYVKEAQENIKTFENTDRQTTEDVSFWNQCTPRTKQNLQKYLSKYPNGKYAIQAKSKIAEIERIEREAIEDSRMFNQCRTRDDYKEYLRKFPTGQYVKKAKEKIVEFDFESRLERDIHVSELKSYKQCSTKDDTSENSKENHKASLKGSLVCLISTIVLYTIAYLIRDEYSNNFGGILFLISCFLYMVFAFEVVSNKKLGMAICVTGWFVMIFYWSDYATQPLQSILPILWMLGLCVFWAFVAYLGYKEKK